MRITQSILGLSCLIAAAGFVGVPRSTQAQGWKPERPIEIVIGCAPGCGPDNMARLMQRVFQEQRFFEVPISVQNRPGGGGTMGRTYVNQFAGNGHYVIAGDRGMLASHALGRSGPHYTDLTPVAILFGEYIGVAVKADSPIKSGRDLIERLQKNPSAASFGIATSIGNINHQGVAAALKTAGVDIRKTRNVIFDSGALAITALLGGHIDAVPVSVGLWVPHLKTGAVRVIAVTSSERLPDLYANVPTWREQGANVTVFNWRAMFGARGMTPAQVAYWENTFKRFVDTPEWKAELTLRNGVAKFMGATAMKKYIEEDYAEVKAFLVELDLAKKSP
jgi:putative tricarboxylic transport membrane protein